VPDGEVLSGSKTAGPGNDIGTDQGENSMRPLARNAQMPGCFFQRERFKLELGATRHEIHSSPFILSPQRKSDYGTSNASKSCDYNDDVRILISAGEASGEMYGAQLIEALHRHNPSVQFFGAGGEQMRAAGCDIVVDANCCASM
jgi:hypothetical protein